MFVSDGSIIVFDVRVRWLTHYSRCSLTMVRSGRVMFFGCDSLLIIDVLFFMVRSGSVMFQVGDSLSLSS